MVYSSGHRAGENRRGAKRDDIRCEQNNEQKGGRKTARGIGTVETRGTGQRTGEGKVSSGGWDSETGGGDQLLQKHEIFKIRKLFWQSYSRVKHGHCCRHKTTNLIQGIDGTKTERNRNQKTPGGRSQGGKAPKTRGGENQRISISHLHRPCLQNSQ